MLYDDKYLNHFFNISCGRARLVDFAGYTVNATKAPGVPAAVAAKGLALADKREAFMASVVKRLAGSGSTQTNTKNEQDQWDDIHDFLTETDVKIIRPAYFGKPGIADIYPAKLGGLTASTQAKRLPNFEAYTEALEANEALLTAAPGKAARKLLEAYRAVADAKDQGESGVATLIQDMGPEAVALCWALWDVHCAGLAAYPRNPEKAAALFNYGLLPRKKRGAKQPVA